MVDPMNSPLRRDASKDRSNGILIAFTGAGGLGLCFVILVAINMARNPPVDLATIKADVSSDEALVKSLDAMRATMGPSRKKVFNADLLYLAARYTSRATSSKQTHEYVKSVIGGLNAYQIHAMVEEFKGVRHEPL